MRTRYRLDPQGLRHFRGEDYYGQETDLTAITLHPTSVSPDVMASYNQEYEQIVASNDQGVPES